MRRIRYSVAMSLDGYIAGPKGEADWIIMDPDIDFNAIYKEFDSVVMGRGTFEFLTRGPTLARRASEGKRVAAADAVSIARFLTGSVQ
ncbi:MAG: dihydrofolate reductase family protein [Gemmataceae bacterium]|nr:dihydrofolate reductase family protein [Gemmataceae bacterium]